jgi:outer membrane protein OmpA-like peptidoglycan-associated protein
MTLAMILLGCRAWALDLGGLADKAVKAKDNPNAALKQAGDAAGDQAAQQLTAKLKNVQNENGPIVFKKSGSELDAKKSEKTLKAIDGIIKQFPGLKVQIEGHTDNKGKAKSNLVLSQKRAQAVVAWLKGHLQTPADRMVAKGFGDTQPIADNKTDEGRAKNRRVDFSVIKP